MPERPLVLTGFMGSGKSSVGRLLASQLSWPFIDLDAHVVAAAGCSINEIFSQQGEPAFRKIESECLNKALLAGKSVVATGGGAVISRENRISMRRLGIVINLCVSLTQVLARLEGVTDRPLLTGSDAASRVKILMDEREQFYADADIRIDTDGKSVEDVAAEIQKFVKEFHA